MPLPLIMLMGAAGRAEAPPGSFRFEVVTAGADTFQLPIYDGGTYDFHVDWGDSSSDDITTWNDAAANHSYAGADTYNVVITGTLVGWRFNNVGDTTLIYDISEWGVLDVGNLQSYFFGCSNLTITATDSLNCPDTTDFRYCFRGCTSLTSIPSGLFDDCPLVTTFYHCFYGCTSLTSIPPGLFDSCTAVTDFTACFRYSIITSIPPGLFDSCTLVTNFSNCFEHCASLTSIPSGLFDNCTAVTDFVTCFYNCTSLTSIPSGLFDNCTAVTTFRFCFGDCTGINTDLPADLILYNIEIDDCRYMFTGCANMTGDGTAFVDKAEEHGVTLHSDCFTGCTSLPDYNLIPANWGGGGA